MTLTFDGINKTITVSDGTTTLTSKEVYSAWKNWVQLSDNSKYESAFRTFGGDPTLTGQYAPSYFFLTNGWRLVMTNLDIIFSGNIYTEEEESPFINTNSNITHLTTDASTVTISSSSSTESSSSGFTVTKN